MTKGRQVLGRSTAGEAVDTPRVSPLLLSMFSQYGVRSMVRHLHAVRLSRAERPEWTAARGRPLIVYLNHPAWWDPLVCLTLANAMLPERRHFAPIEASALAEHPFYGRLGFFGVESGTARGARRFLEVALAVLDGPDAALWIAAAGRLSDPRQRPIELQPALGHLACRLRDAVLLPLALEYPFWDGRLPEALARFGEPVLLGDAGMRATDWTEVLASRLDAAQERLAAEAMARDPAGFEVLLGGRPADAAEAAAAGVYDVWRRFKARLGRRRLRSEGAGNPEQDAEV
jgi:1-acyl-sn-glycerol-3-phosphate acyltransferase